MYSEVDPWLIESDDLEAAMNEEMDEWTKLSAHPSNVNVDQFLLDMMINALRNFLIKTGVIDEQEFLEYYRRHTLEQMRSVRVNMVAPTIKEIRRQEILNGTRTRKH